MSKENLISYYNEYVRWCILLYIKYIKRNAYPGREYWQKQLKASLKSRSQIFKELDQIL